MKNQAKIILNSLLISTLAISSVVLAETQQKSSPPQMVKSTQVETKVTTKKGTKKTPKKSPSDYLKKENKEVVEAFKKVFDARQMIPQGKEREAIDALKEASKKFEEILAADPNLKMAPIASDMQLTQTFGPIDEIKAKVNMAQNLLDQGKVQDARAILLPLSDEMVTQTAYLPMVTYPETIKLATKKLLNADKPGAIEILDAGFGTVVEEQAIVPLSLLRAEAMITAASKLEKTNKKDVLELLNSANEQLQLATILGYTNEASDLYLDLSGQIKALKKEAEGPNAVEKLYEKMKTSFTKLIHRHLDKTTIKAPNKAKK